VVPFTDEPSMSATNVTNMSYATAGSGIHLAERHWSPQHGHTATVSSTSDLYSGSSGQIYNNPGNVYTTAAIAPSTGSYPSKSQLQANALSPDSFIVGRIKISINLLRTNDFFRTRRLYTKPEA